MTNDEQEFQKFMSELTQKAKEISENYEKLSENNKRKVQANVKPFLDAGSISWLFGNKK